MARKRTEENEMDADVNIDLKNVQKSKDMSVTSLPGVGASTAEKLSLA